MSEPTDAQTELSSSQLKMIARVSLRRRHRGYGWWGWCGGKSTRRAA